MNRPVFVIALVAMIVAGSGAAVATWSATGGILSGTTEQLFETVSQDALENGTPRTRMEPATWRPEMLDERQALTRFVRAEGYSSIAERPKLVRLLLDDGATEAWALVVDGSELRMQTQAGSGPPAFRIYLYDAHTGEFLRVVEGTSDDEQEVQR